MKNTGVIVSIEFRLVNLNHNVEKAEQLLHFRICLSISESATWKPQQGIFLYLIPSYVNLYVSMYLCIHLWVILWVMVLMNSFSSKEFCKCGRSVSPACPRGEQLDLIAKELPVTSIQRTLKSFSYFCSTCAKFFNKYIISDKRAGGCSGWEVFFSILFLHWIFMFLISLFLFVFHTEQVGPPAGRESFQLEELELEETQEVASRKRCCWKIWEEIQQIQIRECKKSKCICKGRQVPSY